MMSVVLLVLVVVLLIEMVLRPDPLPFYRRFGCPIVYSLGPAEIAGSARLLLMVFPFRISLSKSPTKP